MTETYRQKLLDWLSHAALLLLFWWVSIVGFWFFGRFNPDLPGSAGNPADQAGLLADGILVYPLWFIPIFVWHLFDMLQPLEARSRLARFATKFSVFLSVSTVGMATHSLAASAVLTAEKCPTPVQDPDGQVFAFITCVYGPPQWLMVSVLAFLLFAYLLSACKAVISVISKVRK